MGYKFIKLLGKGSYGSVYLAVNELSPNKEKVAIKKFYIGDTTSYNSFKNELKILKKINSQYLVKILDYYKDSQYIYLVMEYAPQGDLDDYIRSIYKKGGKVDTKFVDTIIYQVSEGLKVLHRNKIIHRDIKTSNILVFNNNLVKITDFGVSKQLENNLLARSSIGTPYYMSPEIISGTPYDFSVDFWALGCLIYKVLTNHYPFEANNMANLVYKIKIGNFNLYKIPKKYRQIIKKLINDKITRGDEKDINNFIISSCNTFLVNNNSNLSSTVKSNIKLLKPLEHKPTLLENKNVNSNYLEPINNKFIDDKKINYVQKLHNQYQIKNNQPIDEPIRYKKLDEIKINFKKQEDYQEKKPEYYNYRKPSYYDYRKQNYYRQEKPSYYNYKKSNNNQNKKPYFLEPIKKNLNNDILNKDKIKQNKEDKDFIKRNIRNIKKISKEKLKYLQEMKDIDEEIRNVRKLPKIKYNKPPFRL